VSVYPWIIDLLEQVELSKTGYLFPFSTLRTIVKSIIT